MPRLTLLARTTEGNAMKKYNNAMQARDTSEQMMKEEREHEEVARRAAARKELPTIKTNDYNPSESVSVCIHL